MRDGRLKILMVITTLDTGGAEKHLHLLSRELAGRGHRIEVVYLKGSGSLAPDFEAGGVSVDKVAFEGPGQLPGAVVRLAARIRREGYHLVHSHLLKADLVAAVSVDDRVKIRQLVPGLKVEVVPNGVDCVHFEQKVARRSPKPTVLFVGNFKWLQNKS